MSLCTVIIPTIENCMVATDFLVNELQEKCNSVSKIIFINNKIKNSLSCKYKNYSKVQVIHDLPNLMVNPAWNYGMSLVKTKYYCILNDDLLFHGEIIDQIVSFLEKNDAINLSTVKTMVDYDLDRIYKNLNDQKYSSEIQFEIKKFPNEIKQGWFMLARTSTWEPVPPCAGLIMFGDNYIYIKNQEKYSGACIFTNNIIYHLESSSVSFCEKDKQNYQKKIKPVCPNMQNLWKVDLNFWS